MEPICGLLYHEALTYALGLQVNPWSDGVREVSRQLRSISDSSTEQSAGVHQVGEAVSQMDQVTQQNAAMVEESTAASHSLAKEAGELSELASKFDIGETSATSRVVHRPAPKRLPAPTPSRPAAPSRPLPTHGNAALKPAAESEEDNWEDF